LDRVQRPALWIAAVTLVAVCFLVFNALRILLYLPNLRTCWVDPNGCSSINLFTWCSWIVANASTSLYMWLFQHDVWGLILNAGNAVMCALIAIVAAVKKRRCQPRTQCRKSARRAKDQRTLRRRTRLTMARRITAPTNETIKASKLKSF
jgi:hypothetical protein